MSAKRMHLTATIESAHYGMRDFPDNQPGLWFGVSWEAYGALITMQGEESTRFFAENSVYKTEDLNGRQCVIDVPEAGTGLVGFVRLLDV